MFLPSKAFAFSNTGRHLASYPARRMDILGFKVVSATPSDITVIASFITALADEHRMNSDVSINERRLMECFIEQSRNGFVSIIRFVADHFARHGIAVLIYDKRGVGESTGDWSKQPLDDLATDALAGFKMLQSHKEIDLKQIGLWGASQAGWIMPKMTTKTKDIAFIISVSCAGVGISVGDHSGRPDSEHSAVGGTRQEATRKPETN